MATIHTISDELRLRNLMLTDVRFRRAELIEKQLEQTRLLVDEIIAAVCEEFGLVDLLDFNANSSLLLRRQRQLASVLVWRMRKISIYAVAKRFGVVHSAISKAALKYNYIIELARRRKPNGERQLISYAVEEFNKCFDAEAA